MLLHSTKEAKLDKRRAAHLLNYMYKKKDCIYLLHIKKVNTRACAAPLFKTIIPKCKKYKNSVLYNGATRWNSLPVNIRNISYYESSLHLDPICKKEICCISKNLNNFSLYHVYYLTF